MTQRDRGARIKRQVFAQGRLDDTKPWGMNRKKHTGEDPKRAPRERRGWTSVALPLEVYARFASTSTRNFRVERLCVQNRNACTRSWGLCNTLVK
jgi:hypothetical protein